MTKRYIQEISDLADDPSIPWELIDGKTMVVTGATGLIGGMVVRTLLARNELRHAGITVICPVRNLEKGHQLLGDTPIFMNWEATAGNTPTLTTCDFIIHCASNTDSHLMVERPVDTIRTTVDGTYAMLELARMTDARMVFVSSMEVYGAGSTDAIDEKHGGELDAMNVRSSYPQSKQLAETLCSSYAKQYGTETCVARLAQSFGPGVASTDRRVFAEFARCCIEGRDIVLLTDGSKSNMYVYTADAVRALLLLVVKGVAGEAYNVANENTFCSIWEMANMVTETLGTTTNVTRLVDEEAVERYAVSGRMWLDTSKLQALGWEPRVGLREMYNRMVEDWR